MVSDPRAYVCAELHRRGRAPAVRSTTCWFSPPWALLILSLVAVMRRRTAGADPDLGWVSERWLAEYRADPTHRSL